MIYAQQDQTNEQIEHGRIIASPDYEAGIQMGWKLAEAHHGITADNDQNR